MSQKTLQEEVFTMWLSSITNRFQKLSVVIVCLMITAGWAQQSYFAAIDGANTNNGSIESPWDIGSALKNPLITGGDTLYIRGGTYLADNGFWIELDGAEAAPVVVKPYNHEKVILKGNNMSGEGAATLRLQGKHIHVYDLVVTQTDRKRTSAIFGSWPTDVATEIGVVIRGAHCKLINCFIYDVYSSLINSPSTAVDAEIYGNIGFNAGWMEISPKRYRGHGHAIYFQNRSGKKRIENNILFKTHGYGLQFYSEGGTGTTGADVRKNIVFMAGALETIGAVSGGYTYLMDTPSGTILDGNYSYLLDRGVGFLIGYNNVGEEVTIRNNYGCGGHKGMLFFRFKNVFARNNTYVMENKRSNNHDYLMAQIHYSNDPTITYQYDIDSTTYYTDSAEFHQSGHFSRWQSKYGVDAGGSCTYVSSMRDVPNKIEVIPNKYEAKRGHIVIYNHKHLPTVTVDVSNVLKSGDTYWLYDVEDMRQPIQHGVYEGFPLQIPTNQESVFPVGGTEIYAQSTHSGKNFGAFLLSGREIDIVEDGSNVSIAKKSFSATKVKSDSQLSAYQQNSSLQFSHSLPRGTMVEVFDVRGRSIMNRAITGKSVNVKELGEGVYLWVVHEGLKMHSGRFVL